MDFECKDNKIYYFKDLVQLSNEEKINTFNNFKNDLLKINIDYNKLCTWYMRLGEIVVALKVSLDELNDIKKLKDEKSIDIKEIINKTNVLFLYYKNKFKTQIKDDIYVFENLINQNKNKCNFIIETSLVITKYDYDHRIYKLNGDNKFEYKIDKYIHLFNFKQVINCIYKYLISNLLRCRDTTGVNPYESDYCFFD
jgi:hypothetical protein